MSESTPVYQRFFAELKRRRVFRVMAVYGAVGFILMQIVELLVPALLLPEWTYRFIALLLLLGFPIAVILAWAFELTPEGVKRTEDAAPGELTQIIEAPASTRWPAGLLALAGVMALLAGAWYVGRQSVSDPGGEGGNPDARSGQGGGAPVSDRGASLAYVDPADGTRPKIAVLPFVDMSQARDQEYFSDGITEEILNVLSKIEDLQVTARTSAFAYKGTNQDLREVGRELDVDYLLEGSVRKSEDQLRITVQLIDTDTNSHLWSDTYDRRLENVFEIQTEIAEAIADELRLPLGLEEGESLVTPTGDLAAYDLYLAGRAQMRSRGLDGITQATELFEAAVARDSNWAPAWAGLAESRALYPFYADGNGASQDSVVWRRALEGAETAALKALDLDPSNASARVALANVYRDRWEWADAEREYIRAIELDVDNVEAHQQYAEMLFYSGRPADALIEAARALSLDRSPIRLNVMGWSLWLNGRRDEAVAIYEEAIQKDPESRVHFVPNSLAQNELLQGRYREALDRFGPVLWDSTTYRLSGEALESGDPSILLEYVGPIENSSQYQVWPSVWIRLGMADRAIDGLKAAIEVLPYGGLGAQWDPEPQGSPIREHPRFREEILPLINLEGHVVRTLPPDVEIPGI
jgi:TolB-like protein/tetratricopeptide (TPR) repeat protein